MAVAFALNNGENEIVTDGEIDPSLSYSLQLTHLQFCKAATQINALTFIRCGGITKIKFQLDCLTHGKYLMELIDNTSEEVKHTFQGHYQ